MCSSDLVVKSINGIELDNVQAAIKLLHNLKGESKIDFVMSRGGTELPVSINVQ